MTEVVVIDWFNFAMSFAWRPENDGQGPHNDLGDAGGETSWGVTFGSWTDWLKKHGQQANTAEFLLLQKEAFLPLYRINYWNACCCGSLGPVGIPMFDIGMMSGPGNAIQFLQTLLQVKVDYVIGPKTLNAFNARDPSEINALLLTERDAFYESLENAPLFEKGWERRASDCKLLTDSLITRISTNTNIPSFSTADLLRTAGTSYTV
jgi:lysozyme family protein